MARILCTIVRRHLTVLGACHSTPPSGMKTAHSMPPGGAGVGICAVARNCGAIRCHRMARPSYTQRHRVARLDLARPAHTPHLPHTSCALTVYPAHAHRASQILHRHLKLGGEASSDALLPRKRGQVSGWHHRSRSFLGASHPCGRVGLQGVSWRGTHMRWRKTHMPWRGTHACTTLLRSSAM